MGSAATPEVLVHLDLEESQCVGCAICSDVCPTRAWFMGRADLLPIWTAERCNGCTLCALHCPTGAITVHRNGRRTAPTIR